MFRLEEVYTNTILPFPLWFILNLAGFLFDVTGTFTYSFWLMGVVSLFTVASMGLEDLSVMLNNQWRVNPKQST